MSTITSTGAFSTLSANNARLYSRNNNAFAIHHRNNFITAKSPKVQIKPLSKEQRTRIKAQIKRYTSKEHRGVLVTTLLTVTISAGLVLLASQLLALL